MVWKVLIIAVVMLACCSVYSMDELDNSNKWNIELTPYFWAAELKGDATLRGRTGPVEVGFSDLLDNLDIAFMGRLEAWKGEWGDLTFMYEYDSCIEKIAVVAEANWKDEMLMYLGAGRRQSEVKFFFYDEAKDARDWLKSESE